MKSRSFEINRQMTPKSKGIHPSVTARSKPNAGHRTSFAYARARVSNAAIHDRAPRAAVRMRIGIVSDPHHRDPSRWPSIRAQIKRLLTEHGGRGSEAVTLLAAATDRLFAMMAHEHGMRLSLVIPCKNFPKCFATPGELSEYLYLQALSQSRTVLDHTTFDRPAFDEASKFIVDTCDLLVVIGSGNKISPHVGTGSIVQYAGERGKLLVWIDPEAPLLTPRISLIR
jgi:hypothetical protein